MTVNSLVNEGLHIVQPSNIFLEMMTISNEPLQKNAWTHSLFLELRILGNEQCDMFIDPTLRKVLLELLLQGHIQGIKLKTNSSIQTTICKKGHST